jgi:hypothetical protein
MASTKAAGESAVDLLMKFQGPARLPVGYEIRSCSSSILMEEAAEPVASVHQGSVILCAKRQTGRWIWRLQSERPVRPMPVVMIDIDPQYSFQVTWPNDEQPIQAPGADRANPPLRERVRIGCLHRSTQHLGVL